MQIESFQQLIEAGLEEPNAQRLLLLLVRMDPAEDGALGSADTDQGQATLAPVMATDKPLTSRIELENLLTEADEVGARFDLVFVSSMTNSDGGMPRSEDAEPYLRQMAETVLTGGDLSQFAVFNRQGKPVRLSGAG